MFRQFVFLLILFTSNISFAQVEVSSANTGVRYYTTLIQAFSAINSGTHTGVVNVTITASHTLLTGTATLTASGVGFTNYTSVTVRPSGGNFTISGSANGPLVLLNGADNVTIDGINSGTNSLTFTNSNTSQGHVIQLTNGASGNTITRCTLLSSNTVDFWGVITLMGNTGNSNNTITYNSIGSSSSGNPTYGIIARGETPSTSAPATQYSTNVTVRFNNIYNYASASTHSFGIYILDGHSDWIIQGNKFYQTATLTLGTTGTRYHGAIWIYSITHSGFSISDNIIGHANSLSTGTYIVNTNADIYFWPITLWLSSTATSNVDGNIIRAINFSTNSTGASLSANGSFGVFSAIWARAGNINIGSINGNTIGQNSASVYITLKNTTTVTPQSLINGIYTSATGVLKNNSINQMHIGLLTTNSSYPYSFFGFHCTGSHTEISDNMLGDFPIGGIYIGNNTFTNPSNLVLKGFYVNTSSTLNMHHNASRNLFNRGEEVLSKTYGFDINSTSTIDFSDNQVLHLNAWGKTNNPANDGDIFGININSTAGGNIVSNNKVYNILNRQNTTNINTSVIALSLRGGNSSNSTCFANRLYHALTGSINPTSYSTYLKVSAGNWFVHHNRISDITNYNKYSTGIESSGNNCSFYYNSIYLQGGNSSNLTSTCFKRTGGNQTLINNILFNGRTIGSNYAAINSGNTNLNSNYNLFVSQDTGSVMMWNNASTGWYNYNVSNNPSDKFSWCSPIGNLSNMFIYTDTADLRINPANPNCWYVNGKGMPVADIDYDWELANGDRSATISDGATDIGADEVVPTVAPPAATHTGSFAAGQSSVYVFGGRTIAQIDWQPGSTLPSLQPTVLYYSGNNPPYPIPGKNTSNCYWKIDAPNTTGMLYQLKLWMSPAVMGAIPLASDLRMAKNSMLSSSGWSCACTTSSLNTTTYSFTNTQPYNSFSFFTATDINSPLPVELMAFSAIRDEHDIQLHWTTASELNSSHFDIERSIDGYTYTRLGEMPAAGSSYSSREYSFSDTSPENSTMYYRLRMVDLNGEFLYSPVRWISGRASQQPFHIYPIPAEKEIHIRFENTNSTQTAFAEIVMYDLNGRIVLQNIIRKQEETILLPGNLADGFYLMQIKNGEQTTLFKLPVRQTH